MPEGAGYFIIINVKYSQPSRGRAASAEATRNASRGNVCEINARKVSTLQPTLARRTLYPFLIYRSSATSGNGPYTHRARDASCRDADGFIAEKIREQPRRDCVLMCRASQKSVAFIVTPRQQPAAKLRE